MIKNKNRSLQAQAAEWKQKIKRASGFASCDSSEGSATVETVLVLPIFLCAMTVFLMMGQSIVTEGKIQHAVTQTAHICADQKALERTPNVIAAFYSVFEMSPGDSSCIFGKKAGIRLSIQEMEKGESVQVKAVYRIRISTLFFGEMSVYKTATAVQRVFCGYVPHDNLEGGGDNSIVYVAENGTVYHTSLTCSHICISISGEMAEQMLKYSRLNACEKCIGNEDKPSRLYITAYGDCFHSSLNCSGLKRSVRAIPLREVGSMRMCTRCAAREAAGSG